MIAALEKAEHRTKKNQTLNSSLSATSGDSEEVSWVSCDKAAVRASKSASAYESACHPKRETRGAPNSTKLMYRVGCRSNIPLTPVLVLVHGPLTLLVSSVVVSLSFPRGDTLALAAPRDDDEDGHSP